MTIKEDKFYKILPVLSWSLNSSWLLSSLNNDGVGERGKTSASCSSLARFTEFFSYFQMHFLGFYSSIIASTVLKFECMKIVILAFFNYIITINIRFANHVVNGRQFTIKCIAYEIPAVKIKLKHWPRAREIKNGDELATSLTYCPGFYSNPPFSSDTTQ